MLIDDTFARLKSQNKRAFIPFVTAGDPDLSFTEAVIRELDKRGASIIEVGIPYSDPIADGPVIQASYTRALQHKIKLSEILAMLGRVSKEIKAPLVTMVSYAIIYRHGIEQYVQDAAQAGVSGFIVPDLLVEEAGELAKLCQAANISLIQLCTPTTPRERALKIAEQATGFLYYVSVAGITGERTQLPSDLVQNVAWLRSQTKLPICIGFGISTPDHVKLLAPAANGLIVGSGIVRRMAEAANRPREAVLQEVGQYAATLMAALP
jgi:tryptophan synthase alpha chain